MVTKSGPDPRYFDLHARVCQTIAHARRLQILYALESRELSVTELETKVGFSGSSLSQHLSILKSYNVITGERRGRQLFYRIANPKVMEAVHLMAEVVMEIYQGQADIMQKGKAQVSLTPKQRKRPSSS